jgi:hypothetical protein
MTAQLLDSVNREPTPSQLLAERVAVLAAEDTCAAADAQTALLDIKEMLAQFPVDFSTGTLHGPPPAAPLCAPSLPPVVVRGVNQGS